MPYREFHYRWEYELQSSPEQLWSFVADTNRFNRDTGVPALQLTEGKRQRLRNARRRLRLSVLGVPVEWEEQPFEWIRPSRFGVVRKYTKGPIAELRVLAELTPQSAGSKLTYEIWVTPKSLLGFLLIPLQFGYAIHRKFSTAFERYDKTAFSEIPVLSENMNPELSSSVRGRLDALKEKLLIDGVAPQVVEKLFDFIERADDFSLSRIRPYELADRWDEPRRPVLEACLLGTRHGLLDMQWDLLCPLCRGPQESSSSLSEISSKLHCDTCRIDFTVNLDRFVEITFKPNASVRRSEIKDYCMGSPQRTPHVVVQQLLAPHTKRSVALPLEKGSYRLRTLELPGEQLITVAADGAEIATSRIVDRVSGDELKLAPRTTLQLENESDAEQLFILERMQWSDQAATAAEVTALQIFRDLFSSEALRPGEQISVGTLTVLFTDLRHSTQLYREIGDATAFGRVLNHFDVLKKAIAEADGALVKTIGDAVMGVFRDSASALKAILMAQQVLADPPEGTAPLTLKAGMHSGPCIAVTLNDRLDYFGSTVNMAARLEGLSTGHDVIISRPIFDDPDVRELINSSDSDLQAVPFEIMLKGFEERRFELWRVGRKTAAAAPISGGDSTNDHASSA
jgi:class 3 adenylate cyclase